MCERARHAGIGVCIRLPESLQGLLSAETWEFDYGIPYDGAVEQKILDELAMPYYDGLTILGGEPFEIQNQETVAALIGRVKKELPARNIWMYTGYTYDRDLVPADAVIRSLLIRSWIRSISW